MDVNENLDCTYSPNCVLAAGAESGHAVNCHYNSTVHPNDALQGLAARCADNACPDCIANEETDR